MNDLSSAECSKTEDAKEAELENFLNWYEENKCDIDAYFNELPSHVAEEGRKILEQRVFEIRFNLKWIRKYRKIEEVEAAIDHSKDLLAMSKEFVEEVKERSPMHSSK